MGTSGSDDILYNNIISIGNHVGFSSPVSKKWSRGQSLEKVFNTRFDLCIIELLYLK